ncbi:hypothetical protein [Aquabacterium sp.]|uniref:hypothetical protein n=1 Tax=Aquabacterium sp. TaxID=1872578 RepID=UPI0025C3AB80|nr:hypothetical protein [Aquabacterium sp.]
MNRGRWAAWELQLLRDEYGSSLTRDIAKALNRGFTGVRTKALELGLKCRTQWTPQLDEIVALMLPDAPAAAVGELIGATEAAVRMRAIALGVKKAPGFAARWSRQQTLARSPFTPEIAEVIELLYPDTLTQELADFIGMPMDRVHAYAAKHGWNKTDSFIRETARARSLAADHPMRRYRFPEGHVPANKGVKGWDSGGRSHETRFKKGERHGVAARRYGPVGKLTINADGYLARKIGETNRGARDWEAVHRLVWIEANGPIPPGHLVRFKPGRRTTELEKITLDALECITLAENARRNSFRTNYPPEVVKLIETRAHLQRMINKRERAMTEETP